mgnify:CR=1 FL=1
MLSLPSLLCWSPDQNTKSWRWRKCGTTDKLRKKISYVFFTIYFKPQFNHWKTGTELVVLRSFSGGSCFWAFVLRVSFGYWATMPAPVFKVELWFPFYHVAWILGFKLFLLFCRGFGIQCGIDECGMAFKSPGTKKTTLANLVIGYRRLICGIFILFRYSLTKINFWYLFL